MFLNGAAVTASLSRVNVVGCGGFRWSFRVVFSSMISSLTGNSTLAVTFSSVGVILMAIAVVSVSKTAYFSFLEKNIFLISVETGSSSFLSDFFPPYFFFFFLGLKLWSLPKLVMLAPGMT